jgi:hypothetical protein
MMLLHCHCCLQQVIYDQDTGVLRAGEFDALVWDDSPPRAQIADVLRVHDLTYVDRCASLNYYFNT